MRCYAKESGIPSPASAGKSRADTMKKRSLKLKSLAPEGVFLARWLKAPHKIGALTPASRYLARAMADQVAPDLGLVIELGAGTGNVTQALLDAGLPPDRLIVVERDPAFYILLKQRFPFLKILRGDAARLRRVLAPLGIDGAVAVVSSLPLLSMPKLIRQRIVEESFAVLAERGTFIQYTYGAFSPLRRRQSGLKGEVAERVWRNFPPAAVWRFRRRGSTAQIA
jgi:phosphatidylethanolamine/phosphatidyl-N-methylethanolamine N-methyltransferase